MPPPFSFTTNYDADSWARYSADKTRLRTIDIQPSIGVELTDWLRVGGALNVEYTDAILSNALPNVSAAQPDGRQELSGDGWDLAISGPRFRKVLTLNGPLDDLPGLVTAYVDAVLANA